MWRLPLPLYGKLPHPFVCSGLLVASGTSNRRHYSYAIYKSGNGVRNKTWRVLCDPRAAVWKPTPLGIRPDILKNVGTVGRTILTLGV